MGHRKKSAPKHGSLAYLPRGRAKRTVGRIRFWPKVEEGPTLLGFMGYKAGMTHITMIEDKPGSLHTGKETAHPATILDVPPIIIFAIRAYTKDRYGLHTFSEAWMKSPPKDFDRAFVLPEEFNTEENMKKIEEKIEKIAEIRLLTATQPRLAAVPKKKPDISEIKVDGGSIQEQLEYAKSLLGKTVSITDVFKEGHYHGCNSDNQRKRLPRSSKTVGNQHFAPQIQKDQTWSSCDWTMETRKSPLHGSQSRTDGLPPKNRIQQAHPKNWR